MQVVTRGVDAFGGKLGDFLADGKQACYKKKNGSSGSNSDAVHSIQGAEQGQARQISSCLLSNLPLLYLNITNFPQSVIEIVTVIMNIPAINSHIYPSTLPCTRCVNRHFLVYLFYIFVYTNLNFLLDLLLFYSSFLSSPPPLLIADAKRATYISHRFRCM